MPHRGFFALFNPVVVSLVAGVAAAAGQFNDLSPDLVREPEIAYFSRRPTDPVAKLNARLQSGAESLSFDETTGYLPAILEGGIACERSSSELS